MKNIGIEIDKILKERKLKQKDIAEKLDMTPMNLSKILRKNSIDAELLERIAILLGINVGYFFDEPLSELKAVGNTGAHCAKCEHLEELLSSKENEIEVLKKLVGVYEGNVGRGNKQAS